jgi:hypothetical protein
MQMSEELKLDFIKVVTYFQEVWSPFPEFQAGCKIQMESYKLQTFTTIVIK